MQNRHVVLDTNIWVSYFMKQAPDKFLRFILDFEIAVFTSIELLTELNDVLSRKKILKHLMLPVEDYLHFHTSVCRLIEPTKKYIFFPDPDDDFFYWIYQWK
jgi:putative PIN family toxin of toxin-antitoxin system